MIEDFSSAVEKFKNFLKAYGYSSELLWIFQNDIRATNGNVWLRSPICSSNAQQAENEYERGRQLGFGIVLQAYCMIGSKVYCVVGGAEDADEASHMMASRLKLSIVQSRHPAKLIRSKWQWELLRLLTKSDNALPACNTAR